MTGGMTLVDARAKLAEVVRDGQVTAAICQAQAGTGSTVIIRLRLNSEFLLVEGAAPRRRGDEFRARLVVRTPRVEIKPVSDYRFDPDIHEVIG